MAFRQPQHRPQASRQLSFQLPAAPASDVAAAVAVASPPSQRKRALDDSEEWVLFTPGSAASVTDRTNTVSTGRTPRTAGLSRLSDFGSLDTAAARSDDHIDADDDDVTEHGSEPDEEAELDSLDDGLHAFHEPSEFSSPGRGRADHSGGPVLPTHDGLGTFGEPGGSAAMQQQLWQFEQRAAPRRKVRRTSSVQRTLDALGEVEELTQESERMRRIEKWRLEQSRALLEEIERETRRMRRRSRVGSARTRATSVANTQAAGQTSLSASSVIAPPASESQPATTTDEYADPEESESFWQRFTRRVIRDLMGIDENLLSIILGETLPSQTDATREPEPSIAQVVSLENREAHVPIEETWQHRLLQRIARELGILVHQLSEHPGAYATFLRTQEVPAYAGLPNTTMPAYLHSSDMALDTWPRPSGSSSTELLFNPSLPSHQNNEAPLWGIEEEPDDMFDRTSRTMPPSPEEAARLAQDREYWERELDVKMVFNFLKSRFSSRPSSPSPTYADSSIAGLSIPTIEQSSADLRRNSLFSHPSSSAAAAAPSARRAALIRQHHPLTSRHADPSSSSNAAAAVRRRYLHHPHHHHHHLHSSTTTIPPSTAAPAALLLRTRPGSSCASQSTKKSKRSAGSSRNYWDIGGSVGTGGPASALGAWGEVGI